jgi:hypothetical protein
MASSFGSKEQLGMEEHARQSIQWIHHTSFKGERAVAGHLDRYWGNYFSSRIISGTLFSSLIILQ